MTKIFEENEYQKAAECLLAGNVVCFPTETVYGIGVIYDKKASFDALVAAKHRAPDKPFALMCSSFDMAKEYIDVSPKLLKVMEHFLPGEVTFLVKAKQNLPDWVTLGTGIIGIRVPNSPFVQSLIGNVGKPCLVTSANISGEPTSTSFEETYQVFHGAVPAIVRGTCKSLKASTIIDVSNEKEVKLIREGSLPYQTVLDYWRETV